MDLVEPMPMFHCRRHYHPYRRDEWEDGMEIERMKLFNVWDAIWQYSIYFCQYRSPYFIGIAGGTASGKTSICRMIMKELGQNDLPPQDRRVDVISTDSFYRVLSEEEKILASKGQFNFDHPDALDYELIELTMMTLSFGKPVKIPVYDFAIHARRPNEFITVHPVDVVLIEGIPVLHFPELRNFLNLKVFIHADDPIRLQRRIVRDQKERGRTPESIKAQYETFVKPAHDEFCEPTKKYADIIIMNSSANDVILQYVKAQSERNRALQEQDENAVLPPFSEWIRMVQPSLNEEFGFDGRIDFGNSICVDCVDAVFSVTSGLPPTAHCDQFTSVLRLVRKANSHAQWWSRCRQ